MAKPDLSEAVVVKRAVVTVLPLLVLSAWLILKSGGLLWWSASLPYAVIGFASAVAFLLVLSEPEAGFGAGARLNFIDPIVVCSLLFGGPFAAAGVATGYVLGDFGPWLIERFGRFLRSERLLGWVEHDDRFALLRRTRSTGSFIRIQTTNVAALLVGAAVAWGVTNAVFGSPTRLTPGLTLAAGYVFAAALTATVAVVIGARVTRRGTWADYGRLLPKVWIVSAQIWVLALAPGLLITRSFGWVGLAMYVALLAQLQFLSHRAGVSARLAAAREEESRLAFMDGLTGVTNRRGLEKLWADRRPNFLAVLDIDHFKRCNDTYGHLYGDAVLRAVASILAALESPAVYVGRFGGEEFVVGMSLDGADAARFLCERIRRTVQGDESVLIEDGSPIRVTVSIGWTAVQSDDDWMTAFRRADGALYRAKESGRNRVCAA